MYNEDKAREAVRLLLEAVGEDPDREGLKETPDRVARMYKELLAGMDADPHVHLTRCFSSEARELVVEKEIPFYSLCEHHMLPFFGTVSIGYIPNGRVVGLSKLARTVEVYARRLQLQERMTQEIADAVARELDAKAVLVYVEAEHLCMSMRGVKKPGTRTSTVARRGDAAENRELTELFFTMVGKRPEHNE